jgi:predicted aconitase with swiveling domain
MSDRVILRGHPGVGPVVEGEALVSRQGFSARYDLNRKTGEFCRKGHDLFGESIAEKILVHTTAKGGVATAWALLDLKSRGLAPAGLIFQRTNPIMVQGAVLASLALMDQLEPDPLTVIATGDRVRIDPSQGIVEVTKRLPPQSEER